MTTAAGQIAEVMNDGVWSGSPDLTEIEYVNPAFEKLWGYSAQDLYDSPQLVIGGLHPDDRDRFVATLAEHPDDEWIVEFRVVRPDGSERLIEAQGFAVNTASEQEWRAGTCRDVTARREAAVRRASNAEAFARARELTRVAIWEMDTQTLQVHLTPELGNLLGFPQTETDSAEDLLDRYVYDDDKPSLAAAFERTVTTGEPYDVMFRMRTAKDGLIWVRVTGIPEEVDGEATRVLGFIRDVTYEAGTERRLEASERLLAESGRTARIGGWELDAETLEISWTDVLFDIFEIPQSENPPVEGAIDLYHPEDQPKLRAAVEIAVERGESFDLELRAVTARRRPIHIRAIAQPVVVNGTTVKLWGSLQDITEQVEIRTALATSVSRFETILDAAPDSIILVDQFGVVTRWNQSSVALFGYSEADAIGKPLEELIVPERYRAAHREGIDGFRESGNSSTRRQSIELEALKSDGSEFPAEVSIRAIETPESRYAIGIVRDVTERTQQASMLRAAFVETIGAMTQTIETRDPYTADHQRRVSQLGFAIAEELGLPAETVRGVQFGAMIHDLGKISVPAEILDKPGNLSEIEFDMIKRHPEVGVEILSKVDFPWPVAEIVGQHHERIDGSGYPKGLQGAEISQEARIVAVADVVEAMSSHRPYRPALGIDAALAEIAQNRGTSYDADVVDACLRLFSEGRFDFESA